ncbi:MAG: hypothetical protein Q7U75_11720, partial [Desulfobacterales bacterium]|nr:hypothetical protein [Desulfobacterales bacterium]
MRLLGSGLSSAAAQASAAGTTTLGDTEVWIDQQPEPVAAALLSVDPSSIELLLPPNLSGPTRALRVKRSGVESAPLYFTLSPVAAEFYESGGGTPPRALLSTSDGAIVGAANPVGPGQVINAILTGMGAWSAESGSYLLPFKVFVDGAQAAIISAAPNGDYPGIESVSFELPSGIRSGVEVPIWIEQNGRRSRPYTVPVIAAAALSAISLFPASVEGGANVAITVTLDMPAPANGVTVALASDSLSVHVPTELTIPEGTKSATISVRTTAVTISQAVRLTASYRGVIQSVTLNAQTKPKPTVSGITLFPLQVTGGQIVAVTVTLSEGAPLAGLDVQLSSSNAAVTVPASIRFTSSSVSYGFTLTPAPVSTTVAVTIT